jgi:phage FluMu protein Com
MKLTGQDIHEAFLAIYPYMEHNWNALKPCSKDGYGRVACELNKRLEVDSVTISSIRCPQCKEMLQAEHAEDHACWIKGDA